MAETAEEAEMRELEEGVARLNDAGAPLLEAEDAQGCDSKGDALAHSKSSEKRGYSRRGATPAEKEADCASMWSAEADKYAIEQLEGGVPVSKLHEKLDEAGHKPLHTHAKFTVRIVAQRYGHHKQKRGGRRYNPGEHDLDAFTKDQKEFYDTWAVFLHSRLFNEDGTKKKRAGVQTKIYAAMAKEFGQKFTGACGKSKLQDIANAMKFEDLEANFVTLRVKSHETKYHYAHPPKPTVNVTTYERAAKARVMRQLLNKDPDKRWAQFEEEAREQYRVYERAGLRPWWGNPAYNMWWA